MLNLSKTDLEKLERKIKKFKGLGTTLESALGALVVGQYFGWRVLRILHGNHTLDKYQDILGLKFQEVCPEVTELSGKNVGYKASRRIKDFWAVVQGRYQVEQKGAFK